MRDRFYFRLFLLTLACTFLIFLWRWPLENNRIDSKPRPVTARGDLALDEKSTIEIFENSRNSVVFISTKQQVLDVWTRNVFSVPRGNGSGFIWDGHGHVVTNNHVIQGASEAQVKLADGRSYKAALVGASPEHDIAVLRIGIGFKQPPPVPVGASSDLKVGQKVFAIGNPFGLDWTLTSGLVSALDRTLPTDKGATINHLIQTDAAINPGNSGGPLLDSAGRLIGINTAIFSPSGAYAGVGFAVPVDTVNRIVPQLITNGKYIRPTLGIEVDQGINERLTRAFGVEGVVVLGVVEGSAADKAGLKGARVSRYEGVTLGDIIISIDGDKIASVPGLFSKLDDFQVGETVKVGLSRAGKEQDVPVTLEPGI